MSVIEFSERDYAAIKNAAAAEGMPLDAWIVAHLPLDPAVVESTDDLPCSGTRPARTMADLFAGHVGQFSSGSGEPRSETVRESFGEHLEGQRRSGRL